VDVNVDNGTLTISAHRTSRSEESVQWLASERFFGKRARPRKIDVAHGGSQQSISATSSDSGQA
jgi:HSP20 family protein